MTTGNSRIKRLNVLRIFGNISATILTTLSLTPALYRYMPQLFSTMFPSLPLEIFELIVSYHGEPVKCPENGPHWFGWSSTLLALHLTSRQFRVCVLREMSNNFSISSGDPTRPNKKLRHLLLSSTPCPRLGESHSTSSHWLFVSWT